MVAMTPVIGARFEQNHRLARSSARAHDWDRAWSLLEDNHVLSQPFAWPHVVTHTHMLTLAVRSQDLREVLGQAARIALAVPGSLSGRYPKGNTGRSDVSMFAAMPIRKDLADLLEEAA